MRLQELVNGNSSKLNLLSDWWAYDYDREKHWAQELEHIGLAEFPLVSKNLLVDCLHTSIRSRNIIKTARFTKTSVPAQHLSAYNFVIENRNEQNLKKLHK